MNKLALTGTICFWIMVQVLAQSQSASAVTEGPKNGTLLIIGGGASDMFYDKFAELIGGFDQAIVVIPTAASSQELPEAFLNDYRKRFEDKGFTDVTVLHTRDPQESNTDKFIEPITRAKAVWFSGGRQWRHADSYLNTRAHDAFHELLDRGGVIAGSSAGATIQGSYLARGDTKANTIMMGDHEEGLGFLSNVAIDQHLLARNRQFDLFEILDHKPDLLGIGLDEDTGIIVRQDRFSVFGSSYVMIYDGTRWSAERNQIKKLPKGSREFYTLRQGDEYDLRKRKVVEFEDRKFIEMPMNQLKRYEGVYQSTEGSHQNQIRIYLEDGKIMSEQHWSNTNRKLFVESASQMISEDSHILIQFNVNQKEISGLYIPRIDVHYERLK